MTHLKVGDRAPDFSATDQHGTTVSLKDFRGKKLILFFYPKDGTPVCTAEACHLRDHFEELVQQGYAVVGVSPQDAASHARFAQKHRLPFSLLDDSGKQLARAYGVWGRKKLFGASYMGVLRTTFVIDENGMIEKIIDKVDAARQVRQILG